jgi:hypothetical protein
VQPFSQGNNFLGNSSIPHILENQALQKLLKDVYTLLKALLDHAIGTTSNKKKDSS